MRARYWDSVTFIGWLAEEPDKVERCRHVIQDAEAGKVTIVSSALTIAEVLWVKGHERLAPEQAQRIQQFFAHSYIAIRDLDRTTAEMARQVIWDHGIKPKDAIHVATALDSHRLLREGLEQFDTFDEELVKKALSLGGTTVTLRCSTTACDSVLIVRTRGSR